MRVRILMIGLVATLGVACGGGDAPAAGEADGSVAEDAAAEVVSAADACTSLASALDAAVPGGPRGAAGVVRETRDVLEDTPGAEVLAVAMDALRGALVDLGGSSPESTSDAYAWGLVPVIAAEATAAGLPDCAAGIAGVTNVLAPAPAGFDALASCRAWLIDGETELADDFFTRDSTGPISLTFGVVAVQGWLGEIEAAHAADPEIGGGYREALIDLVRAGIRWDQTAAARLDGDLAQIESEVDAARLAAGAALDAAGVACLAG